MDSGKKRQSFGAAPASVAGVECAGAGWMSVSGQPSTGQRFGPGLSAGQGNVSPHNVQKYQIGAGIERISRATVRGA